MFQYHFSYKNPLSDCLVRRIWEDNIKTDLQEVGCGRGDGLDRACSE